MKLNDIVVTVYIFGTYVIVLCDSKCSEYVIVFEETICGANNTETVAKIYCNDDCEVSQALYDDETYWNYSRKTKNVMAELHCARIENDTCISDNFTVPREYGEYETINRTISNEKEKLIVHKNIGEDRNDQVKNISNSSNTTEKEELINDSNVAEDKAGQVRNSSNSVYTTEKENLMNSTNNEIDRTKQVLFHKTKEGKLIDDLNVEGDWTGQVAVYKIGAIVLGTALGVTLLVIVIRRFRKKARRRQNEPDVEMSDARITGWVFE